MMRLWVWVCVCMCSQTVLRHGKTTSGFGDMQMWFKYRGEKKSPHTMLFSCEFCVVSAVGERDLRRFKSHWWTWAYAWRRNICVQPLYKNVPPDTRKPGPKNCTRSHAHRIMLLFWLSFSYMMHTHRLVTFPLTTASRHLHYPQPSIECWCSVPNNGL